MVREHRSTVGFQYDNWEVRRSGEPVNIALTTWSEVAGWLNIDYIPKIMVSPLTQGTKTKGHGTLRIPTPRSSDLSASCFYLADSDNLLKDSLETISYLVVCIDVLSHSVLFIIHQDCQLLNSLGITLCSQPFDDRCVLCNSYGAN